MKMLKMTVGQYNQYVDILSELLKDSSYEGSLLMVDSEDIKTLVEILIKIKLKNSKRGY